MTTSFKAQSRPSRIASLDGLRFFSALMVIVGHELYAGNKVEILGWGKGFSFGALLGCQIFFVISAFIITHSLLTEKHNFESINLPHFYLRRFLKLWPTLIVFLAITTTFHRLEDLDWALYLKAITMTVGWFAHPFHFWKLAHLWSLTIEEFYYLIVPLVLARLDRKNALRLLQFFVAAAVVSRSYNSIYFRGWFKGTNIGEIHVLPFMDFMAIGSMIGFVYTEKKHVLEKWIFPFALPLFWLGMAVMLVPNFLSQYGKAAIFTLSLGPTISALGIGLLILSAVCMREGILYRILNHPLCVYIGLRSYPVYLFQQIFLEPAKNVMASGTSPWVWFVSFVARVALTLLVSSLCFRLIEIPCQRFYRKWIRDRIKVANPTLEPS